MKAVVAPLAPIQQGPDVADLQDALRLFVDQTGTPISDLESIGVSKRLNEERAAESYGEAIGRVVELFRVAFGFVNLNVRRALE